MTIRVACLLVTLVAATTSGALARKPEIVQVTSNTYMIFKEDHKGIFGSLAKMKIAIIKQANEFAAGQGMVLVPISCREKPLGQGPAQWATFEYQFKLVPKSDPEAKRAASLGSCPDVVVQSTQSVTADVTLRGEGQGEMAAAEPADLYADLLRLEDLRKREILSAAEFESQKRVLLGAATESEFKIASARFNRISEELVKLDDLLKRGILTDAEFTAKKLQILNPASGTEHSTPQ